VTSDPVRERFHEASWDEPVVTAMGRPGSRGVLLPRFGDDTDDHGGAEDVLARVPPALRRTRVPALPELSQPEVLRHFTRLSQMILSNSVSLDLGLGTCTMKYNPPLHEDLARGLADLHPLQDEDTMQGVLEVIHRFEGCLRAISGLDRFSLQPGGGAHGVFTNALMIRAFHGSRGEGGKRDEIVTSIFSHPADAGSPATAGFKVLTLYPGPDGYPEVDALKAAVSERTAGLMITNPEDTGLFNPHISEFTRIVHEAGGLCAYDQANTNGILGIARAREAGFDLCQFNLHKTFATPHGSMGLAAGAVGVTERLAPFLPTPTVERDPDTGRLFLDFDRPQSIGTVRAFLGNPQTVLKAYAWVMSLGATGLRTVAETAVLNNNYLATKVAGIRGAGVSFAGENDRPRLEQVRYSWERMAEETGVGTEDVERRMVDFGLQSSFASHHPWVIPEPFTLEPSETVSKEDLDEYVAVLRRISDEAYAEPETVTTAPHRAPIARIRPDAYRDPVTTWRAFLSRGPHDPP